MPFGTFVTPEHDMAVTDGQVRYYTAAAGRTVQQIADDFLQGYHVEDEDDDTYVRFSVRRVGDDDGTMFKGHPGGLAVPL